MIRFSALGDVAMLAPIVKELVLTVPDVEVTVLSKPSCAPLFEGLAGNVRFIGADVKGEYRGVRGLGRLFKELHSMRFDYVADMHGVLRTHYLTMRFRLAGYRVERIDKERAARRELTAPEGKKVMRQLTTSFDKYRDVLRRLGLYGEGGKAAENILNGKPVISFSDIDTEVAEMIGNGGVRLIGIAPFAAHGGKVLPVEKTERVVARLAERGGVRLFLFGGGGEEKELMERWQNQWSGTVVAASSRLRSMRRELQLMSRLDVMLTMDSANMHLASLVGTRVVSVWGATHPYAGFLGWGQSVSDCVQLPLPCRPCSVFGKQPCRRGDFACMNNISEEEIVEKIIIPTY